MVLLDHCGAVPGESRCTDEIEDWRVGLVDVRTLGGVRIAADHGRYSWVGGCAIRWPDLLRWLATAPLVVFEEIGVGKEATDFKLDVLLEVLDRRANDPVRPFVVTSNLAPSEVSRVYDDRVSSRILSGTAFHLAGDDRRLPKK